MAVDSKATEVQSPVSCVPSTNLKVPTKGTFSPPLREQVLALLSKDSPRYVVSAPGRLDVLGGSAEYSGSLIVTRPLAEQATVAAQRRTDGKIQLAVIRSTRDNGHENVVSAHSELVEPEDGSSDPAKALIEGVDSAVARCAVATLTELTRSGLVPGLKEGVSLAIGSNLSELSDGGNFAAISASQIIAIAQAFSAPLDPLPVAALCQQVEDQWLRPGVGVGDAMCSLFGESIACLQVPAEPRRPDGTIVLPGGFEIVGLDSGVVHEDVDTKFARVRCASFMGRELIDRIIKHDDPHRHWNGLLAHISIADYVDRFRDRLPTKLSGKEFLDRFGETDDPCTEIEPAFAYKIRSRTEHHIYENARARQFVECVSRAVRTRSSVPIREAGEVLYAAHWSYGQRCGLGSIETDFIVSQVRKLGGDRGIYGAKTTGRGCGGVVAVLIRSGDDVFEGLQSVQQRYEAKTGRPCRLLRGSCSGAWVSGAESH